MKAQHQSILAEQVRFGGCDYSKSDFLDAYHEICEKSLRKHAIIHAWEKSGLVPFNPHIVLKNIKQFEPYRQRPETPEP
jgi:hypothetical protein